MQMERLVCALLLLVAVVAVRFDQTASQYQAENANQAPVTTPVVFTTADKETTAALALPDANLVIGVISSPENFDRREAVRSTWATLQSLTDTKLTQLSLEDKEKMVVRFIVGTPKNATLERLLAKEASRYRDIVRVPVEEDWMNLTYKTGEFFKWVHATFNFQWAFKCDDDSFVRVDLLLETLKAAGTHRVYTGKMWTGTPVDRRVDKYSTSNKYSTFAAGAGYALSKDLVDYIVRNYYDLHKWVMEDVTIGQWMSGLDVQPLDNPHFHSMPEGCDKNMIVQNPANPTVMHDVFFNSVKGVPCHSHPDPFDPSTKNITDHVFLELGIPKAPRPNSAMGTQMLIQQDNSDGMEDNEEEEAMEAKFGSTDEGMRVDTMNGNRPSSDVETSMNEHK